MDDIKSSREKDIEKFINDNVMTQKEWANIKKKKLNYFYEKYNSELEDYIYIDTLEEYNMIQVGGYIRYFNYNEEFRWGGILAKKYKYKDVNMMLLLNSAFKKNTISFENNYIFYKNHTSQSDKMKKIFMSYLEKYKEN